MLKQILKSINIANRKSLCFVTVFLSCDFKIWYYYFNGYFLQRAFSRSSQHFPDTCSVQTHLLRGIKSSARRNEISSRNSETTSKFVVGSTNDLLSNGDVPNPNNIKFSSQRESHFLFLFFIFFILHQYQNFITGFELKWIWQRETFTRRETDRGFPEIHLENRHSLISLHSETSLLSGIS